MIEIHVEKGEVYYTDMIEILSNGKMYFIPNKPKSSYFTGVSLEIEISKVKFIKYNND